MASLVSVSIKSINLFILSLLSSSFLLPSSFSLTFNIQRFDPTSNEILYEGAAVPSVGVIELTDPKTITYICQTGRAIYNKRIPIWNNETRQLTSFTSHFTFIVDTLNQKSYGAGFTFFLAPVDFHIPPNSIGGFLGLYNTTTTDNSDANQIIHVEFDSTVNDWDPPYEHVGINVNSISSATTRQWNASLHSGDTGDAWINYDAKSMNLTVVWSYQTNPDFRKNVTLSYHVDLRKILPEWCIIGFTAATGVLNERHKITSWEFNSTLEVSDLEKSSSRSNMKLIVVIVISIVAAAILIMAAVGVMFFIKRKKKRSLRNEPREPESDHDDLRATGPKSFTYNELSTATSNFSDSKKLGEGGFGTVYKGYLIDADIAIAVKRFSKESRQGRKEFVTEVKIISQLRHRNLVQLIGWCQDDGEFLLVYEYMPNGSLDFHLFGKNKYPPLSWEVRYKISLGLASALIYLHEEWDQCVLHRDIKSSNIMLDSSFNVKLGDFGLARLVDHDILQRTSALAGTMGYMAPEYIVTRKASRQSDVYSFGVVVLELVTGKRSSDVVKESSNGKCFTLLEWVWDLYGNGGILSGLDEKLISGYDSKEAENLILVGLWCVHPDSASRPSIRQVIQALRFEASVPKLPTKMPVPVFQVAGSSSASSNNQLIDSTASYEIGR